MPKEGVGVFDIDNDDVTVGVFDIDNDGVADMLISRHKFCLPQVVNHLLRSGYWFILHVCTPVLLRSWLCNGCGASHYYKPNNRFYRAFHISEIALLSS